jgi:hypothetical protein
MEHHHVDSKTNYKSAIFNGYIYQGVDDTWVLRQVMAKTVGDGF